MGGPSGKSFSINDEEGKFLCSGSIQTQKLGPANQWLVMEGGSPIKITKSEEENQNFRTKLTLLKEGNEQITYAPYQDIKVTQCSLNNMPLLGAATAKVSLI